MSFIATQPPAADTPADSEAPATIENDGWFPDISMTAMRDAMRLDGTVTDPRLKLAVIDAIIHVNAELADWQQRQSDAGYPTLEDVPSKKVAGESIYVACYRRAVYSSAKADLIERYRDFDSTQEGNKKAESLESPIDEQRRNAHWAIADIVGRTHITVELI